MFYTSNFLIFVCKFSKYNYYYYYYHIYLFNFQNKVLLSSPFHNTAFNFQTRLFPEMSIFTQNLFDISLYFTFITQKSKKKKNWSYQFYPSIFTTKESRTHGSCQSFHFRANWIGSKTQQPMNLRVVENNDEILIADNM